MDYQSSSNKYIRIDLKLVAKLFPDRQGFLQQPEQTLVWTVRPKGNNLFAFELKGDQYLFSFLFCLKRRGEARGPVAVVQQANKLGVHEQEDSMSLAPQ